MVRGPKAWSWRWRRNPLRRRADTVEAWVVLCAWLLAVVAGALAGWTAVREVERGVARERLDRRPTAAVVAQRAPGQGPVVSGRSGNAAADEETGRGPGGGASVWAKVRWTASDGSARDGRARVAPGTPAGAAVTVWTDPRGRPVARPPTAGQARTRSLVMGGLAGVGAAAVPLACGRRLRGRLERRRMDQWDAEWARFDPPWGRRTR
ncbi:hypothetical protein ACF061_30165 [Streptomyces sp. NPDC015220]|uniref:Rv1733c family protein n=1 Tax=Streptomyces sp. NPDC015220 TaxID=3364947 RepID=UPI003701E54F